MKVILHGDLSCESVRKLLTFTRQCGADYFTVTPSGENLFQDVLRPYYIGPSTLEVPVQPEECRSFERVGIWRLSDDSLLTIVQLYAEWLCQPSVRWGFYGHRGLFMVLSAKVSYFIDLRSNQWEALFRLGFHFSFRDFYLQEFTDADLPENKHAKEVAQRSRMQEALEEQTRESFRTATDEERREAVEEAERILALMSREEDGTHCDPPLTEAEKGYQSLISRVFHRHFKEGTTEFEFENREIYITAREMKIKLPAHLALDMWNFLSRPESLPQVIKATAPKGKEWVIAIEPGEIHRFQLNPIGRILRQQPKVTERYLKPTPGADSNEYILAWWSTDHDALLKEDIALDGWRWWPSVTAIESLTPKEAILQWQRDDPMCLSRKPPEVLVDFARARAHRLGYLRNVQWPPDARGCIICEDKFFPRHHYSWLQRAKHVANNVCHTCVHLALAPGSNSASRKEVLTYLRKLTKALGRVPNQGFSNLDALDETNIVPVMKLLRKKPSEALIKGLFGSWLAALVEAKVLNDGARRTPRGTQCLANDGHVCLSVAEKTIDDLLTKMGIAHEKEVPYPEGRYRCDFVSNGVFIEYFGFSGDPDYDDKTKAKKNLCKRLRLKLVAIYPEDLSNPDQLRRKLESIKPLTQI